MVTARMDKAGVVAGVFKIASVLGASFGNATGVTIFSVFKGVDIHDAA